MNPNVNLRRSFFVTLSRYAVALAMLIAAGVAAADPPTSNQKDAVSAKPLASDSISGGAIVEIWRVFRSSDGLLQIQWAYRNPTGKTINLLGAAEGRDLLKGTYIIDPKEKKKYSVARVTNKPAAMKGRPSAASEDEPLASRIESVYLEPGESVMLWAKFPALPDSAKEVTFYLPNAAPQEDLPIAAAGEAVLAADTSSPNQLPTAVGRQGGLAVEITRVRRTSDGLIEVRWQYVNRGQQQIQVFSAGEARDFASQTFLEDPAAKIRYSVAVDTRSAPIMSQAKSLSLEPGSSEPFWAKFTIPAGVTRVCLYLPNTLPVEDLTIADKN